MEFNETKQSLLKEEWIHNIKYMSPRPIYNHIEIQGELYLQLKDYFKKSFNVSIEASLFLTKEDPSNSDEDLIAKKDLYEEYGVPEYWIVSPMNKKIWIYYLVDNKYELKHSCTLNDKFKSIRFEALEIDLSEVELIEED